jgi:hypothetical protein
MVDFKGAGREGHKLVGIFIENLRGSTQGEPATALEFSHRKGNTSKIN